MKLLIGNKNYSSWSLRPWLYLQQNQIAFEEEWLALDLSNPYTNEALKGHFSNYKVPLLLDTHAGKTFEVWDSLAIMEYLADAFPQADSWPADRHARAVARSVSAEMHSSFAALRSALPMNCRKHYPGYRLEQAVQKDVARIEALWAYCQDYKEDGDWLFGKFSIADAMFAPVVLRFAGYDVALGAQATEYRDFVLANPHVQAWVAAAKAETAVIPEDEIDND